MNSNLQIKVENLSFQYQENNVLQDISFEVEKGDYIGVIGPNGGGKTTLIRLLLGLIPSTNGKITLFGKSLGYVPQRASLSANNFPATVMEIISSGITKKGPKSNSELIKNALELTQINHLSSKLISNLSGGELQKVLIARALVGEPEILILDEPIVGIDTPSQESFYKLLKTLNTTLNITIIFVSHDLDVITNQVTKIFCLNKKLVCHSDPKEFLNGHNIEEIFGKDKNLIHHHHH